MTTFLHAHVETTSSDCDGPFFREYVISLNDDERAAHVAADGVNDFHESNFKARVLDSLVSFSSEHGMVVHLEEGGFDTNEVTDEGSRAADVLWCGHEHCDPTAASQRDVFAEQMGY